MHLHFASWMLGIKEIFPWEMEMLRASSSEHLQSEVQSSE